MLYSHSRILKKYNRDILLFKLDDLGLNGLDSVPCVEDECTLVPPFEPSSNEYSIKYCEVSGCPSECSLHSNYCYEHKCANVF